MNPEISATETKNNVERMICFHRNIRRGQSPDSIMQHVERAIDKRHRKAEKLLRIAEKGGIALLTRGADFFEAAAAPSLSAMTVAELREVAKKRGIKVTTKMTKTALVELLGA